MLKNKRILLIIILAAVLFLIPNICKAALTTAIETTTSSTGVIVRWEYELENDLIVGLKCKNTAEISGNVTIPSTIDGYKVITIGTGGWDEGIFYKCAGLNGVIIPNTVTTIEQSCFENCFGLTSVVIPNSVTSIKTDAFKNCGLSEITFSENLTSIGNSAFADCSGIAEINLPSKLISIGDFAFQGCSGIISLAIPNSVTTIGESAFRNCSGIANLTLSANLTRLNDQVFEGCKGLTSVVIPDKVTTISGESYDGAFYNCTNLEKVLIPDRVSTIEEHAFRNCSKLTIYGNDGKKSKQYAEANNINFDYIANWDKAAVGEDITPPKLECLEIEESSLFKYDEGTTYFLVSAGTNISIKATFDEVVYGEKAPTLVIKCGQGANITLNEGVIQGSTIVYTYTIKDQDKGIISAVSMSGGDIEDESGNKIQKYTCPELKSKQIISWRYVYANGTGSKPTDQGGNGNQQTVTLSSIAITKTPIRNTYGEGESFDKAGMVITATYSDGTTKQITNYTVSPSGELKTTDTKVVISYTENGVTKTVEQKITVIQKTTTGNENNGGNNNGNNNPDNPPVKEEKDPTIKEDSKLPQTGATVMIFAVMILIVIAAISKVKSIKYKDI